MKIAFFTESGQGFKISRNFPNMRTDLSWAVALDSEIHNFNISKLPNCDVGIMICPKKNPEQCFQFFKRFKHTGVKWVVMQEANQTFYQNYSIENQINYLNLLQEVDAIFCHNEIDQKYFKGLIPEKKVFILPSLMIEDAIPILTYEQRQDCIIGGTWCEWYGGLDSYLIAQEFNCEIFAPSMGRKQPEEDYIQDLNYLPYTNWSEWILKLNKFKFGVHLMRTYAAGTFSLNCAFLGIPCLGWNQLDTQRLLFPELSVDEGNMEEMRRIAKHLYTNELFYNHVSHYAKKQFKELFSEEVFVKNVKNNLKEILNG